MPPRLPQPICGRLPLLPSIQSQRERRPIRLTISGCTHSSILSFRAWTYPADRRRAPCLRGCRERNLQAVASRSRALQQKGFSALRPSLLRFLTLHQCQGQLIRAGSPFIQTLDSLQLRNRVLHTHPHQQAAERLGKAGATQYKFHRLDHSALYFQFNFFGTGAFGLINHTLLSCLW